MDHPNDLGLLSQEWPKIARIATFVDKITLGPLPFHMSLSLVQNEGACIHCWEEGTYLPTNPQTGRVINVHNISLLTSSTSKIPPVIINRLIA